MGGFIVLFTPLAEEFAELPVLVLLLLFILAALDIAVPAHLKCHVLSLVHEFKNLLVIGILVAFVPTTFTRHFAIHLHGDPGVCDSRRKRKVQFVTLFECFQEIMYS